MRNTYRLCAMPELHYHVLPTAALRYYRTSLFVLAILCTLVHSGPQNDLGGRVFLDELKGKEHKFVFDPSAKTDAFLKEGDMTFVLETDPLQFEVDGTVEERPHTERERRNAVQEDEIWPGGIIPYEISSVFNDEEKYIILSAMHHWEEKTCIRFRTKNATDVYYVFVMSHSLTVCQSFVGRSHSFFQPQGLTLGPGGCVNFATVVHELGHAIGFRHEHNRPDRDDYIEVVHENIQKYAETEFTKTESSESNLLDLGYDYASIMHYDGNFFSINRESLDTIRASVPFGKAEELSPLDIAKANALYSCKCPVPPLSIVVPPKPAITLPSGITCGQVVSGQMSGTLTSPGFPSYGHNLDCAYIIDVPEGYHIQLQLPNFGIETSTGCSKDYMQFYYGKSLDSSQLVRYTGYTEGRFCGTQARGFIFSLYTETLTVYFHTDSSGSGTRGLEISYTSIDNNECELADNGCRAHNCTNFNGGYHCVCNNGYYFSAASGICYDVNECAYNNGGCQHKCKNSGGSYTCECNSGYYLQTDGKSCATQSPALTPTLPVCGNSFITATGTLQTPNWPQTYPNNVDCEWFIRLPDACTVVQVSCEVEPYGIAGTYPDCTNDYITLYDGHSSQNTTHGPYCGSKKPGNITLSSNLAKIVFHAGGVHSSTNKGVSCTFRSVASSAPQTNSTTPPTSPSTLPPAPPTTGTPPPTTPPSSQCGGTLNSASGSFQSPNWPETYPNNIDCEWRITLPDSSKLIEIECEDNPFGIAGTLPACAKDYLKVYDGHSTQDTLKGTFCHYTKPDTMTMSSNMAMAVFHAGVRHSSSRKGFRCTFKSVNAPTLPPTLPPTTPPQCGGTLTTASGSFQTPNWPQTYPVDVTCDWTIEVPDASKRVEITFEEGFGIAGSLPSCVKDHVHVIDDNTGTRYGPFCHYSVPPTQLMSSNKATVELYAGPAHSSSRRGFSASYRSV